MSATSRAPVSKLGPNFDPNDLPDEYASKCVGDCLEPVFKDGVCLAFSKSRKPERGDFVALWFKPEHVPPGQSNRMLKRLVIGPPAETHMANLPCASAAAIIVETLNPPQAFGIRVDQLLAIHTVIAVAKSTGPGTAVYRRS